MEIDRAALEEWQKQQPLCVLSLDPADRAVLRVAGKTKKIKFSIWKVTLFVGQLLTYENKDHRS